MAGKSIGTLFVDIQARTAQLEQDMGKVRNILKDTQQQALGLNSVVGSFDISGLTKSMLASMLLRDAFKAIIKEVVDVIENIERIPGIPAQTLSDVQDFRQSLHNANQSNKEDVAELTAGASRLWKTFKLLAQSAKDLVTEGGNKFKGLSDLDISGGSKEERERSADPKYDDEMTKARAERVKVTKELAEVTMDLAAKINQLRTEEALEKGVLAETDKSPLDKMQDENKLLTTQLAIKKDLTTLDKELGSAEAAAAKAAAEGAEKQLMPWEHLREAMAAVKKLKAEIAATPEYTVGADGKTLQQDPNNMQKLVGLNKELAGAQKDLNSATKQYGDLWNELGDAMASGLMQGIEKGQSFKTTIDNIASSMIKLIIQQEIEKPLASMFSAGLSSAATWAISAMATGGPYVANEPFIAGENGPELINPGGQSGSVVNAGDTGRMGGGGGMMVNNTTHVNIGNGVSRADLVGMIPAIVQQSKAASMDGVRRGGAYRQAFMGGS